MTVLLLILLGLVLCFAGARSVRVAVLAAGFGASWLLAVALDASFATTLLVSAGGALAAFVVTLLVSKFVMFVAGGVVGAVVGARLFVLVEGRDSDPSWLLALLFVPSVGVICGLLSQRYERRFLMWGTAFAGASLILSGIGRLGTDQTDLLWRPETAAGSVVFAVLWVALTIVGQRIQHRRHPGRHEDQ